MTTTLVVLVGLLAAWALTLAGWMGLRAMRLGEKALDEMRRVNSNMVTLQGLHPYSQLEPEKYGPTAAQRQDEDLDKNVQSDNETTGIDWDDDKARAAEWRADVERANDERQQQLLRVTSEIIAADGVDNVRIPYVAAAAGVTRPVVYKFFPNRHALIKGVLEDFREDFASRTPDIVETEEDADIGSIARAFIDAACDTIEAKGSGGWQLVRSIGPDQEITAISKEFRAQLVEPWLVPLRELTGVTEIEAQALSDMMLSGAGEILQRWIDGEFSRQQVATLLGRIILAVLIEFTE